MCWRSSRARNVHSYHDFLNTWPPRELFTALSTLRSFTLMSLATWIGWGWCSNDRKKLGNEWTFRRWRVRSELHASGKFETSAVCDTKTL